MKKLQKPHILTLAGGRWHSPWKHLSQPPTAWCSAAHTCPQVPSLERPSQPQARLETVQCPAGGEALAPHLALSTGPNGKATATKGSGCPALGPRGRLLVKGEKAGSEKQAPRGTWGRLSQGLGWSVGSSQSGPVNRWAPMGAPREARF